jgi:methylisocitrate lyase
VQLTLTTQNLPSKLGTKRFTFLVAALQLAHLGLPDLGISTMDDVMTDVRRITDATDVPLLVDIDTGFGGAFNIARTVKSMIKMGAACSAY